MTARYFKLAAALALVLGVALTVAASHVSATGWRASVDPLLLAAQQNAGEVDFIVVLEAQADLAPARELDTKIDKGIFVHQTLRETAERTQQELLDELSSRGIHYQPFWILNAVLVRAEWETLRDLAARADVKYIYANPEIEYVAPFTNGPRPELPFSDPALGQGIEWNIQLIGAPELWNNSIDGRDVVIAGQDTGYDWDHPALKNQYRGWDGDAADHDYSWHDAIHTGGGVCGADSPLPCDDHGHGTHTMGTMVGDDGDSNQIGVAPGARWIGCRNMDRGVGTPATYIECFQWFIAPTDISGNLPDPAMAPDVINNSWSCPPSEGCGRPDILQQATEAVRAAGILTVQSAGNSGPSCASVNTPAAIYDATFTVGATTSADNIASYSSRGPVLVDGSNRQKPDVVAPGSAIRSSQNGGGYATLSGTSMAAPHVAGLAALLISAAPDISGDVDRIERYMTLSAVRKVTSQDCHGVLGHEIPNAVYGYGRIDAVAAVRFAVAPRLTFVLVFNQAAYGAPSVVTTAGDAGR